MRKILLLLCISFLWVTGLKAQDIDKQVAAQIVAKHSADIFTSKEDGKNFMVSSAYFDQTSGDQLVYLIQSYKGLPVWNQMLVLAFKDDKLVSKAGSFLSNLDTKTNAAPASPSVSPTDAVRTAIAEAKLQAPAFLVALNTTDNGRKVDFGKLNNLTAENVTAELMWVPVMDGAKLTAVKLVWQVQLFLSKGSDYWYIRVDAGTNTVVNKNNLTVYEDNVPAHPMDAAALRDRRLAGFNSTSFKINTKTAFEFNKINSPTLVSQANYTVIPYPAESPIHPGGTAVAVNNPWNLAGGNAVSLGWQSDGSVNYITSRGNNVFAHEDRAANNCNCGIVATSTTSPDPLNFTYPGQPDYTAVPTSAGFQQFAITNLFYWNNICHDITYNYGFTEVAGNFQSNNQGRGGLGNDYVQADAQDGSGTNNANMSTPPDGVNPRMQMYLFDPVRSVTTMTVNAPPAIAGNYNAVEGAFSTNNHLANVGPITNKQVIYYNDNAASTHDACVTPSNAAALAGKIALINRGNCNFTVKVLNAQNAGAVAVIMVNNVPGAPIIMGGTDNTITIPAVMISDVDGATIAAQLANNVFVTLAGTPPGTVQLDGDIDNGVVTHEFFHGVSNRLTGGPANSNCLNNAEQGGEGWSDYNALMLTTNWATATPSDGNNIPRPIGNYAFGYPTTGPGIRTYPYCTNIAVNPLTYSNLGVGAYASEVHNIGEIWCNALWEMTWQIIQSDGINANLFNNSAPGGNSVAYKLVIEGMKLQPCSPGYIDARDAILQADRNLYNGVHACAIWTAFAKRGMGFGASEGSSNSTTDQTPTFVMPPSPVISLQPANVSVCTGNNANFTVTATGTNPTYQWQESTNGGATWTNITNGGIYSGAITNSLTLTGVTVAMNNYQYRCVIIGGCPLVNSNAAILTVGSGTPVVNTQPTNQSVCAGNNASFTVAASGTNLTYQWQESTNGGATWTNITNGGIYSGATTVTLTLTGVTIGMNNYQYRCNVTGGCSASTVASNAAILSVFTGGTTITLQPSNATICTGGNTTFSLTASGAGLSYQWQLSTVGAGGPWNNISNGGVYTGATTNTLTITGATAVMNGYQYRCIVTGSCPPPVTSNAVVLTLNTAPAITAQPVSTTVCITTNASFSVTATGTNPTYQWQESTNGGGTWNNTTDGGIYSGSLTNTLTLTGVVIGMNGYQYRCVVSGTCNPAATSNAAVLTVASLTTGGSTAPANTVYCTAVNSGTITLTGQVGLIIRWESAPSLAGPWTNINNTTTSLTYTNLPATTYFRAFVQASGCAGAYSTTAAVQVTALSAMLIVADNGTTLCQGDPTLLTAMDINAGAPPVPVSVSQSSSHAITAGNAVSCGTATTTSVNSFWRAYNLSAFPSVNGPYTINAVTFGIELATGATQNITVNLYTQSGAAFPGGTRTLIASQTYSVPAQAATLYTATLTTPVTVPNNATVIVEIATAGVANTRFYIGSNASAETGFSYLSAAACGLGTPTTTGGIGFPNMHIIADLNGTVPGLGIVTGGTFLWTPAAGLNATNVNPVAASPNTTTTYTVTHNNGGGCIRTASITITINQRPAVTTQPVNSTNCSGTTATFTVAGTGTGLTYQWQESTNGGITYTNLTNGAPYSGVTTTTLTINPVTVAMNNNRYRCVLSGICPPPIINPLNVSNAVILVVNATPTVTVTPTVSCGGSAGNCNPLTASGANTYTWSPVTGLFLDCTRTIPYTAGTNAATVYAFPFVNTVYTVTGTVTATGCSATATATVNYTPAAPIVNPVAATMCLGDAAVPLTITSSLAPTTVTLTNATPVAVPDFLQSGAQSNITVALPVGAVISTMSVTLNMSHTYPGDMIFNLKAPNGQILNLYKYNSGLATGAVSGLPTWGWYGAQVSAAGTAAFSTVATAPYTYNALPLWKPDALNTTVVPLGFPFDNPTGYISNAANFNALYSIPNGTWTLAMADGGPGDVGTLSSWSLNITYGLPTGGIWTPNGAGSGLYTDAAATTVYTGTSVQTVYAKPAVSTTYSVTVNTGSCTSAATLVPVTVNNPITITTQAVNATVCTDKTTSFSVTATGTSPSYQWQVSTNGGTTFSNIANGGVYSGATTNTLTITAPPVSMNANQYRCVVSGAAPCGSVNSAARTLTVNPLPTVVIAASPYQDLFPGLRTTITATSTPAAATYTWFRNGSLLTSLSPGLISGLNTGAITLDIDGLGSYAVRVTDINGCTNTSNTVVIADSTSGRVFIYPNPNSGQFQVRYNSTHNNVLPRGINVYNSRGQRVLNLQYTLGLPYARMNVDLGNHGSGVYWIEVVDVDGNRLAVGRAEVLR